VASNVFLERLGHAALITTLLCRIVMQQLDIDPYHFGTRESTEGNCDIGRNSVSGSKTVVIFRYLNHEMLY